MAANPNQSRGHAFAGTSPGGLLANARGAAVSARDHLLDEIEVQEAIWELEQLDDFALLNIGLRREEIENYVRGHRK